MFKTNPQHFRERSTLQAQQCNPWAHEIATASGNEPLQCNPFTLLYCNVFSDFS